jgi:hypothetical protein
MYTYSQLFEQFLEYISIVRHFLFHKVVWHLDLQLSEIIYSQLLLLGIPTGSYSTKYLCDDYFPSIFALL